MAGWITAAGSAAAGRRRGVHERGRACISHHSLQLHLKHPSHSCHKRSSHRPAAAPAPPRKALPRLCAPQPLVLACRQPRRNVGSSAQPDRGPGHAALPAPGRRRRAADDSIPLSLPRSRCHHHSHRGCIQQCPEVCISEGGLRVHACSCHVHLHQRPAVRRLSTWNLEFPNAALSTFLVQERTAHYPQAAACGHRGGSAALAGAGAFGRRRRRRPTGSSRRAARRGGRGVSECGRALAWRTRPTASACIAALAVLYCAASLLLLLLLGLLDRN